MKVFRSIDEIRVNEFSAVTVGSFDGIHLGHQHILNELNREARECECLEVLVTFHPHPKIVLGNSKPDLLTDLDEKIEILKNLNLPALLIIPFTKDFSNTSYQEFVEKILVNRLKAKKIVVGYDHAFGKNREGHAEDLEQLGEKLGFSVSILEPFLLEGEVVSSSRIRKHLIHGDVYTAQKLLGRPYQLTGVVEEGEGRGKKLGYPTANISVHQEHKLIPKKGVYAVDVIYKDQTFSGMMNIGNRPTFNFDPLTLEVHIFNFSGSVYTEELQILFKKFIRDEKKFGSSDELKKQLEKDKEASLNV